MEDQKNNLELKFWPWEQGIKPNFINDEGFEWYFDKSDTDYAKMSQGNKKGLKNIACFIVKRNDEINRVIINDKQKVLFASKSLEVIGDFIDKLKLIQYYK